MARHRGNKSLAATHKPLTKPNAATGRPKVWGPPATPWTGITAPAPTCRWCHWAWSGSSFSLKFIHRLCDQHGRLSEGQPT